MFSLGAPITTKLVRSLAGWIFILLLVISGSGLPAQACALTGVSPSSAQQPLEEDEDCDENTLDEAKLPASAHRITGRGDAGPLIGRRVPVRHDCRCSSLHSASTSGGEASRRNGFGSSLRC